MEIEIRECTNFEELSACVQLQREVFVLPEVELSPVRHLIVTKHAGGFTLGAFHENNLVGFVLSVPAFLRGEKAFYSHFAAVKKDFQSYGIGGKLKWSQRERALQEGVKFIKWTFLPFQAKNAYFNLEKLGVEIKKYLPDFYPQSGLTKNTQKNEQGFDCDRVFAEWDLESEKVVALSKGELYIENKKIIEEVCIINDWNSFVKNTPKEAAIKKELIKLEFQSALDKGLVCYSFSRDKISPRYLFYEV